MQIPPAKKSEGEKQLEQAEVENQKGIENQEIIEDLGAKQEKPVQSAEQDLEKQKEESRLTENARKAASKAKTKKEDSKPTAKSENQIEIEKIMSHGLEDLYKNLPENRQIEFKQKGEENAKKIEILMSGVKVQVKKIVDLLRNWLKMLPGVNKYFLEQESKLKATKLLDYKKDKDNFIP